MAKSVDANIIIRYLIKDNLTQAERAKKLFTTSVEELILTDLVFAEVVWVLQSVYQLPKQEIIESLLKFLKLKKLSCNYPLLINSLLIFQDYNISFIDAYLIAYCENQNLKGVYSFDKGLDKIKTIKRFEP